LAEKAKPKPAAGVVKPQDMERIKRRLDMLDNRLDNIDSMVTAVAERIMLQPVVLYVACPHCGKSIEVALFGNAKPGQ
jgi:tetrahydromethanopterin S-methyltransferase subunit G